MSRFPANTRLSVKSVIKSALRRKMESYNPETQYMPFHTRLLGSDRMRLYSFIQSLNTNFGTAIFEPVAGTVAQLRHASVQHQYALPKTIHEDALREIAVIHGELTAGAIEVDKLAEVKRIQNAMNDCAPQMHLQTHNADLRLVDQDGRISLIDIKTVKPNASNFESYKQMLLQWHAIEQSLHPQNEICTMIALPYNPYHPKPYKRWTMKGMLDLKHEVLVAEDFWNWLAGDDVHDDLLDCFEEVGLDLSDEIDDYFARHGTNLS